jgi:hypothetical protein
MEKTKKEKRPAFSLLVNCYSFTEPKGKAVKKVKFFNPEEAEEFFINFIRDFGLSRLTITKTKFPKKKNSKAYSRTYFLLRYFIRKHLREDVEEWVMQNRKKINRKRREEGKKELNFKINFPKKKIILDKVTSKTEKIAVMLWCKANLDKMTDEMKDCFHEYYELPLSKIKLSKKEEKEEVKKLFNILIDQHFPTKSESK